ncbi:MAG: GNAT family N-acetyltransferase [Longicatena sp.]
MSLSSLYMMNETEIENLANTLTENFFDDDLYCSVFRNEQKRSVALEHFFKHYIKLIKPYSTFVADSKDLNCVMIVFNSSIEEGTPYALRVFWMSVKLVFLLLRYRSWNIIPHVVSGLDMFTSRWVKEFVIGDYYHLDFIFTKKDQRNKGLASNLISHLVKEANNKQFDLTMETHHEENLELYEKLGFVLMSKMSHEDYKVTQYNLLLKYKRGNNS